MPNQKSEGCPGPCAEGLAFSLRVLSLHLLYILESFPVPYVGAAVLLGGLQFRYSKYNSMSFISVSRHDALAD